eukprot:1808014-Prymnesium_polylepis.2
MRILLPTNLHEAWCAPPYGRYEWRHLREARRFAADSSLCDTRCLRRAQRAHAIARRVADADPLARPPRTRSCARTAEL